MKKATILFTFFLIGLLYSCKKTDTTPSTPAPVVDPCIGITVAPVAENTFTITGQSLGTITVTSPIGSGYTYSIGGAFQSSTNFFNLATGPYTITAKSGAGCNGTTTSNIVGYGPKYFVVKNLIKNNCGPCHLNGNSSGSKNFDTDNSITASWNRIKARVVDNLPSVMPQSGPLTAPDKQKIIDWVNAGHGTTN
jgi:hypothetical protein